MLQMTTMYLAIGLMIFATHEGRNMVKEVKELKTSLPVAIFVTIGGEFHNTDSVNSWVRL